MLKKLHCYAVKDKEINSWIACCLDFTLAAQGTTVEEAVTKLKVMIKDYIYDATEGDLKENRDQLLIRKAPLSEWVKYYYFLLADKASLTKSGFHQLIELPIPKVLAIHR